MPWKVKDASSKRFSIQIYCFNCYLDHLFACDNYLIQFEIHWQDFEEEKTCISNCFRSLLFLVVNTWNLFDSIAQSFVPYHIQHNESITNLMSKKVWKWLSNVRNKSPEKHIKKFWYFLALIWAFKTRLNFWKRFSYRDYDALCV